ncbi:MAG: DUF4038 domain-containing protein [Opitutales bacterium]
MKSAARAKSAKLQVTTPANVPLELTLTAVQTHADPFNTVVLDVTFVDPRGREFRVPAFWAGANTWKIRYASPVTGRHTFRTECAPATDAGLHGIAGTVEVVPYEGENPLYRHGPLHVSGNRRYLEHDDGTSFFWLGDTWWMGLCHRLHWPDEFQRLAADRKAKGFTVVQIVAGLYPDMPAFDPRGANEAGFPWEENYTAIRPAYYDAADQRLHHLIAQGITPSLVGAWGYFIPWMGTPKVQAHWRYLIGRYSAWPMTWCIAGEANLPWYLAKNFPYDDRAQVHEWTKVIRYVRDTDPFRRPLTIHPTAINRFTARNATEDVALLDFDLLQTPHAQNEGVPVVVRTMRECYSDPLTLPVINGEPCYEMLCDNLLTAWPRRAFWTCLMNGAAGHTYGANGIWQCNRSDTAHGNSPWGGGYGKITWDDAMNLGGSRHIGFGKALLAQYPWHRFRPHPEWAAFASLKWLSLDGAAWLWNNTETPAKDAPNRRAYFRRVIDLPAGAQVVRAHLRFAGVNHIEARINGAPSGTGWDKVTGSQFDDLAGLFHPGRNQFTIWAEHRPPSGDAAGIAVALELTLAEGSSIRVVSGADWKCTDKELDGWLMAEFDDSAWPPATVLGASGPIAEPDPVTFGPQSAGIPGLVRVHYVPCALPVVVKNLSPASDYDGYTFDCITGTRAPLGAIRAGTNGEWTCPPPAGIDHDWVVVLESQPA